MRTQLDRRRVFEAGSSAIKSLFRYGLGSGPGMRVILRI